MTKHWKELSQKMPRNNVIVLICTFDDKIMLARHIKSNTVEEDKSSFDAEDSVYDKHTDKYYMPEAWYVVGLLDTFGNHFNSSISEDKIKAWHPLPALPSLPVNKS